MRKKQVFKKYHKGDIEYGNIALSRFINYVMRDGKKSTAERVVYGALTKVKNESKLDPIQVFEKGMENVWPMVEVTSKRIGGANYQVPREVRPARRFMLAARWIIDASRKRKGKGMADKLAEELLMAYKNEGNATKKKLDMHRMAEANRAFAHFAR